MENALEELIVSVGDDEKDSSDGFSEYSDNEED